MNSETLRLMQQVCLCMSACIHTHPPRVHVHTCTRCLPHGCATKDARAQTHTTTAIPRSPVVADMTRHNRYQYGCSRHTADTTVLPHCAHVRRYWLARFAWLTTCVARDLPAFHDVENRAHRPARPEPLSEKTRRIARCSARDCSRVRIATKKVAGVLGWSRVDARVSRK